MKTLYSVYEADGVQHFARVDEQQALTLLEHDAARIVGKSRRIKFHLTVDTSAAKVLLAPRYSLGRDGSRTIRREYLDNEKRSVIYQHNEQRCAAYGMSLG